MSKSQPTLIRGFEFNPRGKILNQTLDLKGDVGMCHERCIHYQKDIHSHDRITITIPRGSSRSFVKTYPDLKEFKLSQEFVHVMPEDQTHEQGSLSTVYDVFAMLVTENYYRSFLQKRGVNKKEIEVFLSGTHLILRSPILHEAVQRYFVCRVLQSSSTNNYDRMQLEELILGELFTLSRPSKSSLEGTKKKDLAEPALLRALEFIEANLFENCAIPEIVTVSRTSQASLFRIFKKELGCSPVEYIRARRLDEARALLKGGEYQVGDVAILVGYEDIGAFGKAFRRRFKVTPSSLKVPH
jgi:AraC-like DNA-binding protein